MENPLSPGGTRFANATRGFSGGRSSASPTSSEMRIGYATSSTTRNGERRRICRSFRSSQRIRGPLMAAVVEEADEGGLEVAAFADGRLQLARGAGEQQLAVGQHEHAVRVALGLADVVRRVHDRGPA